MNRKSTSLKTWLYVLSSAILLVGAIGAVLIYRSAVNESDGGAGGYDVAGGYLYPAPGEYSKRYVHDLQLYGGNAAVLADGFMRWFNGLWHGTSLAYTVAFIACILSFVVFVVANNVPSRRSSTGSRTPGIS